MIHGDPRLPDRFWSKTRVVGGCWVWAGTKSTAGHGLFTIRGRLLKAHRVAAHAAHGPFDQRMRNECGETGCVNPAHWLWRGKGGDTVEDRVLPWMAQGLQNKQIARRLGVSVSQVEDAKRRLFRLSGESGTVRTVVWALKTGRLDLEKL